MRSVEEYLGHAARADALAALTDDEFHKAQIARIAEMWRELAEHRRRLEDIEGHK
jgi:hypothetical protein